MRLVRLYTHGVVSGLLAGVAGAAYFEIYQYLMLTEFDAVVNWSSIIGASVLGCGLMSFGMWVLIRFNWKSQQGWLNLLIVALSFVSILGAMTAELPLDIDDPELFPGLVVPMHFFPAVSFFALAPFFFERHWDLKGG